MSLAMNVRPRTVTVVTRPSEPVRIPGGGRPWTVDDLWALIDDENRYELVRGELMMMGPASPVHGRYASRIDRALGTYIEEHELGEVYTAEPGFQLQPEPEPIVRVPDVAFLCKDKIPPPEQQAGFWSVAPDVVIKIISPSESTQQIQEKVQDYLTAGTGLIWLVYPSTQTVTEYRAGGQVRHLTLDDDLDGDEVVPGFRYSLRRLFR